MNLMNLMGQNEPSGKSGDLPPIKPSERPYKPFKTVDIPNYHSARGRCRGLEWPTGDFSKQYVTGHSKNSRVIKTFAEIYKLPLDKISPLNYNRNEWLIKRKNIFPFYDTTSQ